MVAVEPAVAMIVEAGMPSIREKSMALTSMAVDIFDEVLAPRLAARIATRPAATRLACDHHAPGCPRDDAETCRAQSASRLSPPGRHPDRAGAPHHAIHDVYDGLHTIADLS